MAGLGEEMRDVDACHGIVREQLEGFAGRGMTQRPAQFQRRCRASMPAGIDNGHSGTPTTASTDPTVTEW